jgi:thioredoxin-dependent peroxiredoxin
VTERLETGDRAPDFSLSDDSGNQVKLSDYRGERVIVYFYPAAMTPGCTTEACDFRDNLRDFDEANVRVVGISPDAPEKLAKFRDKEKLNFPLLSDPDHATMEAYGAWGEKMLYGKRAIGVIRSTVVVDAGGLVERAAYNVKATGHVAKLKRDLGLAS